MPNYDPNQILDLNTSFERFLYKLSENPKNFEIGSSKLKLWLLKDAQLTLSLFNTCKWFGDSFSRHNSNSVDPISLIV